MTLYWTLFVCLCLVVMILVLQHVFYQQDKVKLHFQITVLKTQRETLIQALRAERNYQYHAQKTALPALAGDPRTTDARGGDPPCGDRSL